jgi:hypothetical protein
MTMRLSILVPGVLFVLFLVPGCRRGGAAATGDNSNPMIKSDFTTPEGAILKLEDAYRAGDIEAAVACKDFRLEARLMLEERGLLSKDKSDEELIKTTAEALEASYREIVWENGPPEFKGVTSTFPKKEPYQEDIIIVTEVCHYPDGGTSEQRIMVGKTAGGWRVLSPED